MTATRPKGKQAAHVDISRDGVMLREAVWQAMRKLRRFTVPDLLRDLDVGVTKRTMNRYCVGLERAGYLKRTKSKGGARAHQFVLARDIGVEAPHITNTGREIAGLRKREDIWRTIRILKDFTLLELVAVIPNLTKDNAKGYLRYLRQAGYVVMRDKSHYRIIPAMCKGAKAPLIQRGQVYDQNLRRVTWPKQEAA